MFQVSEDDVRRHVRLSDMLPEIEKAFIALDGGLSAVFPVARGEGSDPTHFFGVKSGRDGSTGLLGVKAGSYNPSNIARGLPAHLSTTMLFDDATGQPVAVVAASYLNGMRTAAANALAIRTLARADAETLGVFGSGGQALFEIQAALQVRAIRRILVAARRPDAGAVFCGRVQAETGVEASVVDPETAAGADIVVTVTSATSPVMEAAWIRPGAHVSAMGADNIGKMELPLDLMRRASLFVDLPEQAVIIGETQHLAATGAVTADLLQDRTLGALLTGRATGRISTEEITVFDSSGIAVQDIAAAAAAVEIVRRAMIGTNPSD